MSEWVWGNPSPQFGKKNREKSGEGVGLMGNYPSALPLFNVAFFFFPSSFLFLAGVELDFVSCFAFCFFFFWALFHVLLLLLLLLFFSFLFLFLFIFYLFSYQTETFIIIIIIIVIFPYVLLVLLVCSN